MVKNSRVNFLTRFSRTSAKDCKLNTERNAFYPAKASPLPPFSGILLINMNVGYYLFLCPWKLEYESSTGIVTAIHCSRNRKVLYLVMQALAGLTMILLSLELLVMGSGGPIQTVCASAQHCGWLSFSALIKYEIWMGSDEVANMLNSLVEMENNLLQHGIRIHWIFKHPMTIVICLHGLMLTVSVWEIETTFSRSDPPRLFFSFLFGAESLTHKFIYSVMVCAIEYESQVSNHAASALVLLSTILLVMSRSIPSFAEQYDRTDEVISLCRQSTRLCQNIKNSIGNHVHWFGLLALPYYAQQVGNIFVIAWIFKLQYCYYILRLVFILAISSQVHAQFHHLGKALAVMVEVRTCSNAANLRSLRYLKSKILIVDVIDLDGLGMKGRGLTITYSFFGSVMGCILAYSIALIQLREISSVA